MTSINSIKIIYKDYFKSCLIEQLNNEIAINGTIIDPNLSVKYTNPIIKEEIRQKLIKKFMINEKILWGPVTGVVEAGLGGRDEWQENKEKGAGTAENIGKTAIRATGAGVGSGLGFWGGAAAGAAIGTAIFPGVGSVIGGVIGGIGGAWGGGVIGNAAGDAITNSYGTEGDVSKDALGKKEKEENVRVEKKHQNKLRRIAMDNDILLRKRENMWGVIGDPMGDPIDIPESSMTIKSSRILSEMASIAGLKSFGTKLASGGYAKYGQYGLAAAGLLALGHYVPKMFNYVTDDTRDDTEFLKSENNIMQKAEKNYSKQLELLGINKEDEASPIPTTPPIIPAIPPEVQPMVVPFGGFPPRRGFSVNSNNTSSFNNNTNSNNINSFV